MVTDSGVKFDKKFVFRFLLYAAGIFSLGFGIVLCVKCEMGVSPINSIPYVISHLLPLSLGTITILFYLINMAVQLILSPRNKHIGILLQFPVSLVFGLVIDMWNGLLPDAGTIGMRIVCLIGSLLFTAFGIMLLVAMHLIPDPPTGTIQAISRFTGKNIGPIKITYDCSCVGISLLISFLGAHHIIGFGIATIVSAICVGRILAFFQGMFGKKLEKRFMEKSC